MTETTASEMRVDFALRNFVSDIIRYLDAGGDHANAMMNMIERGVPPNVQRRVIDGQAVAG